jgi:hypothetical protein
MASAGRQSRVRGASRTPCNLRDGRCSSDSQAHFPPFRDTTFSTFSGGKRILFNLVQE